MIVFPNAKINLGLKILRRRPDGYHDISTLMYPVNWCDMLEVVPSVEGNEPEGEPAFSSEYIDFYQTGSGIEGSPANNLCVKAADVFFKEFPPSQRFRVHLHKVIPSGAGLGGGSSDAAWLLKVLNILSESQAPTSALERLAAGLGSDCPFFISNRPAFASGRGEMLQESNLDLSSLKIVIAKPQASVSTALAYKSITPDDTGAGIEEILSLPVTEWQTRLNNDFEPWAISELSSIGNLISGFKKAGAVYAAMSGSGSAVFGLFKDQIPEMAELLSGLDHWSGDLS
jgi:4-diphosphocytidyl-2-C-methyl-D-erythritol kinase